MKKNLSDKIIQFIRIFLYLLLFTGLVLYIIGEILRKPFNFINDLQWSGGIFLLFLILIIVTHLDFFRLIVEDIVRSKLESFVENKHYEKIKEKLKNDDSFIQDITDMVGSGKPATFQKSEDNEKFITDEIKKPIKPRE